MSELVANVTCVAIGGKGVLISGEPGCGKSSLALALIDRGASLIGDDGASLSVQNGRIHLSPPPNISGLLEIRNVGLVEMPCTSAPLALAVSLTEQAERMPREVSSCQFIGMEVPLIELFPALAILPLRVEWALRQHGLP